MSATQRLHSLNYKPNQTDYLMKGNEQRESIKDFLGISRQILLSQIQINTKKEERDRLIEYITMEQEKLAEAKSMINIDNEKMI